MRTLRSIKGYLMAISFKRVTGTELPPHLRALGLAFAFQIVSYDGIVTYVESEAEAVALAAELHRDDCRLGGSTSAVGGT